MPRILLVECMQEISSFNPLRSGYEDRMLKAVDGLAA